MKILVINYEFPPLGGGGGRASAHIAKELSKKGHEVKVLTSYFNGLPKKEKKEGYEINRILVFRHHLDRCSVIEMTIFMLGGSFSALKIAKSFKPKVVIAFFGIPSVPLAYLIKKLYNIPYIISLRGGDVPGFSPKELRFYHFALNPVISFLWRNSSAIVANSNGLKELALKFSRRANIDIIPNGIDFEIFHPPLSHAKKNIHQILFVGRMSKQKGIAYLIEAISKLPEEVNLDLVGDGPLRGELEILAKNLGVYKKIHFSGWLSQDEIIKKYQEADLFVLPSLDEGMPNCILEAMACGLPIVATDVSGSRELIHSGKNGILVPPMDSKALAKAIQKCLNDEFLKNQMKKIGQILVSRYSWEKVAEEYLKICQKVAKD